MARIRPKDTSADNAPQTIGSSAGGGSSALDAVAFHPLASVLALLLAYPAEPKPASSPNVNSSEVHLRPTRLPAFQHAGRTHWRRGSTTRRGTGCALRSCRAAPPSPGDPISCRSHSRAMYAGALPHASACQRRRSVHPCEAKDSWVLPTGKTASVSNSRSSQTCRTAVSAQAQRSAICSRLSAAGARASAACRANLSS